MEGENNLKNFKIYTQKNCEFECLSAYTMEVCGCIQIWMISNEKFPKICGLQNKDCFKSAEKTFSLRVLHSCRCYPNCFSVDYDVEQQNLNFEEYEKKFKRTLLISTINFLWSFPIITK